ncbi:MAG: hypothetical protein ACOYVF_07275 [Candidatus Zixiibacteriota bacterium]
MRAIKLSAILLILALALICFVAVPVFSGETDGHPWDADDTGTNDDITDDDPVIPDTTITEIFKNTSIPDDHDGELIINGVVSQVVFFIVNTIYNYQPETYFINSSATGNSSSKTALQDR